MSRPFSSGSRGAPHSDRTRQAVAALETAPPLTTLPLRDGRWLRGFGGDTWLVAVTAVPDAPALGPALSSAGATLPTGAELLVRRVAVRWSRTRLSEAARCSWGALRRLEDEDRGGSGIRERVADVLAAAEAAGEEHGG